MTATLVTDRSHVSQKASGETFKALSCKPVWAGLIRSRLKTLEIRSRRTHHRGPLLICASKGPAYGSAPRGVACCLVDIVDCRPMTPDDEAAAGVSYRPGLWAWVIANVRPVEPVRIKGRLGFFPVDRSFITRARQTRGRRQLERVR